MILGKSVRYFGTEAVVPFSDAYSPIWKRCWSVYLMYFPLTLFLAIDVSMISRSIRPMSPDESSIKKRMI